MHAVICRRICVEVAVSAPSWSTRQFILSQAQSNNAVSLQPPGSNSNRVAGPAATATLQQESRAHRLPPRPPAPAAAAPGCWPALGCRRRRLGSAQSSESVFPTQFIRDPKSGWLAGMKTGGCRRHNRFDDLPRWVCCAGAPPRAAAGWRAGPGGQTRGLPGGPLAAPQ